MGEAQCGGHSGLENFTSKESISLDYLLITDERMYFFLKSTGRYLTICFCIYLNSGETIFSSNINSFSEIQFFFLFLFFSFRDRVLCAVITFVYLNLKTRLASHSDIKHSLLLVMGFKMYATTLSLKFLIVNICFSL